MMTCNLLERMIAWILSLYINSAACMCLLEGGNVAAECQQNDTGEEDLSAQL